MTACPRGRRFDRCPQLNWVFLVFFTVVVIVRVFIVPVGILGIADWGLGDAALHEHTTQQAGAFAQRELLSGSGFCGGGETYAGGMRSTCPG